jgi:hypothetical protein
MGIVAGPETYRYRSRKGARHVPTLCRVGSLMLSYASHDRSQVASCDCQLKCGGTPPSFACLYLDYNPIFLVIIVLGYIT